MHGNEGQKERKRKHATTNDENEVTPTYVPPYTPTPILPIQANLSTPKSPSHRCKSWRYANLDSLSLQYQPKSSPPHLRKQPSSQTQEIQPRLPPPFYQSSQDPTQRTPPSSTPQKIDRSVPDFVHPHTRARAHVDGRTRKGDDTT